MTSIEQKVDRPCGEVKALKKRLTFTIDITKVEVWTDISVAPEYQISSFGRVRRKKPRSDGSEFYPKISVHKATGYCRVTLNGKKYYLHRLLAQAFVPNPEGKSFVDHVDGDKQNNSLRNLRWATSSENNRNVGRRANNTSGFKGVCYDRTWRKWKAQIYKDGTQKNLGFFHTVEDAAAAYEDAAQELHGEFFRKE